MGESGAKGPLIPPPIGAARIMGRRKSDVRWRDDPAHFADVVAIPSVAAQRGGTSITRGEEPQIM
jgi:hypothetical protein